MPVQETQERTLELDFNEPAAHEPAPDAQDQALQNATERAERAEAELARLKQQTAANQTGRATAKAQPAKEQLSGEADDRSSDGHLVKPGSMDSAKQDAAQAPEGHAAGEPETTGVAALREDSMMAHLLDALGRGEDIGHYGRLVFAMIARHFLSDEEVLAELTRDRDFSDEQARQMLLQVEGRDYSPPRRDRIMEWQREQSFPIIPDPDDPDSGNVYKTLRFSKETYNHIGHYREEKSA
jgi:hypothetical protein